MSEEQEYIAKLKKEGFSSAQAFLFYKNRFKKNYAQSGIIPFEQSLEGNPTYTQYNRSNYMPFDPNKNNYRNYDDAYMSMSKQDENLQPLEVETKQENQNQLGRLNVINPFGGVSLEGALATAGQGFGEGDPYKAGFGSALFAVKGARNFLQGYGTGKVNKETTQNSYRKLNEDNRSYQTLGQQGMTFVDPKEVGSGNLNVMTRRDSLDLQKYSIKKNKDMLDRGFVLQNQEKGTYPDVHNLNFEKLQELRKRQANNIPTQVINEKGWREPKVYNPNIYQENIDNNVYKNQETDIGVLDPRSAYLRFDRRASPTEKTVWMNPSTGDGATTYGYDFGQNYAPKPYKKPLNRVVSKKPKSTFSQLSRPIDSMQMGGIKNSEVIASRAITDEGQGNTNLENNEFVKRTNGLVQPVVGEPHIKNGKIAEGVDAQLNQGDKVLSDFIKLRAKDIKELKEQYKISLKIGDTPARALKKIETKIGLTKETGRLATLAEGLEKVMKIKDATTKELSLETFKVLIATQNEKINSLKQLSAVAFEDVFEMQEGVPKRGDGSQLFDDKGKVVTEKNEGVMQQGGIMDMASKYGISKERAEELISMQMGGEMEQQPQEQMQQEVSQEEQIMQMIMQALQGGAQPEQIVEQLISMGLPEEQAVQVVQMVIEQVQPQMEQPTQERIPQEEITMQQGGSWTYNSTTGQNLYKTNVRGKQSAVDGKAYGIIEPEKALQFLYNNFPDIISSNFKDNITLDKQGNVTFKKNISLNKEQEIVGIAQKAMDTRMRTSADVILNNPTRFPDSQVKEAQRYKDDETFMIGDNYNKEVDFGIRGQDNKVGDFTSGRYSMGLDLVTSEDNQKLMSSGIRTLKQLKDSPILKDLSTDSKKRIEDISKLIGDKDADFSINEFAIKAPEVKKETTSGITPQESSKQVDYVAQKTRNVIPNLPENLRLFPSGIPSLRKAEINLERMQPIKATTEPYLAEQARQQLTSREQLVASGLPPQIQQALLASSGAAGQLASNDAISKVENYNRQNQFATDQFNIGQRAKEDITNEQFSQDYQDKMLGSIANTERDRNNYYIQTNLDNTNKWNAVNDANVINARNENYQINPGVGVEYTPSYTQNINNMNSPTTEQLTNWTPEELQNYMRKRAIALKNQQTV